MNRQSGVTLYRDSGWHLIAVAVALAVLLGGSGAWGQGLSYQKATDAPLGGTPNIFPSTAYTGSAVGNDGLWGVRTDFGTLGPLGTGEVWEAGITEDVPELTQVVSGLTPGTSYDLYATIWTDDDENWTIRTGVSPGNLTLYSFNGDHRAFPVEGSTIARTAGAAIWNSPPPPTLQGTIFTEPRPASTDLFMDPLVMLLAYAGRATADASGEIDVYMDDLPQGGGANRTWLDGVAYIPDTDTPIALSATVDRDTGAITVENGTAQNFDIQSYLVNSNDAALDATAWSMISESNASWMVTEPVDPANTPFATGLGEDGGGSTFTISSGGGALSFGNVWNPSPIEDIRVYLTLADDSLVVLSPEYTGTALEFGDFDGNGAIDLVDYETLVTNMHAMLAGMTDLERYAQGDFNTSGAVDFDDFRLFRDAYINANGASAWAALGATVPEPSGVALALGALMGTLFCRRGRA